MKKMNILIFMKIQLSIFKVKSMTDKKNIKLVLAPGGRQKKPVEQDRIQKYNLDFRHMRRDVIRLLLKVVFKYHHCGIDFVSSNF